MEQFKTVDVTSFNLNEKSTIKELLERIYSLDEFKNKIITKISGDEFDFEVLNSNNEIPINLERQNQISVTFQNSDAFIQDTLTNGLECLKHFDELIPQLVKEWRDGELQEGHKKFLNLIELTNLFTQLIVSLKVNNLLSKPMNDAEDDLLTVVNTILTAYQKNNIILVCDILEFELLVNFQKWKMAFKDSIKTK